MVGILLTYFYNIFSHSSRYFVIKSKPAVMQQFIEFQEKIGFIEAYMKTLSWLLITLCLSSAQAQTSAERFENGEPVGSQTRTSRGSSLKADVQGFLRFEAMQYPTQISENPQLNQTLLASMNLRGDISSSNNVTGFDLSAGKYVNQGGSQFQVNEIYHSLQWRDGKSQLSVGRKIEFWSQLDQDWQLGLWQPKSLIDSLRPEDQGLTGAFYRHQQGRVEFLAFASPIFIPTLGPEIKEKNGSLVSDSRWYRPPSDSFPFQNKETKITYALDVPQTGELINHPGSGMRLRYGGETNGVWVSGNYAYKPMNALLYKYKKGLFLPEVDPQTGQVTIAPDVGYHHLYGGDLGYRFDQGMISASFLTDRPVEKRPVYPYVLQQPRPMKAYAVHGETFLESTWFSNPVGLSVNYLRIDGGDLRDYDSENADNGAIFTQRFNYTNAASVRADFSTMIGRYKFMSSVKYMREFDQKGTLMNSEFAYFPQRYLALIVGADVIGVDDSSAENKDGRFLNQFRANDRFYGGMSYVF